MPKASARPVPKSEEGRSLTLYELTGAYKDLSELMDEAEVDAAAEMLVMVQSIEGEITTKIENIGMVVRQKNAEVEWILDLARKFEDESNRLKARARVRENNINRLKDYVKEQMIEMGETTQKIEGSTITTTLSARPKNDKLYIEDEEEVSDSFKVCDLKPVPINDVPPDLLQYIKNVRVNHKHLQDFFQSDGVIPSGCRVGPGQRNLKFY